jgi:hypothetical protein
MNYLTENILNFYKNNSKNSWYLKRYFSNNNIFGNYDVDSTNPFSIKNRATNQGVYTVDDDNIYNINSFGLRGEIHEESELLASGCSVTFGLGVPESATWPKLLSDKINKNVVNLGECGASIETICLNIIKYCLNNKMPKEIFCLFPDFFRNSVVFDLEFYKPKKNGSVKPDKDILRLTHCIPTIIQYKEGLYMERGTKSFVEESKSPHELILNSVNFIYILESFCLSNNIKLNWSTWDEKSNFLIKELLKIENFKLKNYKSLYLPDEKFGYDSFNQICNLNHNSEFQNSASWFVGSDYSIINNKKVTNLSHPGIHFHHHVADFFMTLKSNLT